MVLNWWQQLSSDGTNGRLSAVLYVRGVETMLRNVIDSSQHTVQGSVIQVCPQSGNKCADALDFRPLRAVVRLFDLRFCRTSSHRVVWETECSMFGVSHSMRVSVCVEISLKIFVNTILKDVWVLFSMWTMSVSHLSAWPVWPVCPG